MVKNRKKRGIRKWKIGNAGIDRETGKEKIERGIGFKPSFLLIWKGTVLLMAADSSAIGSKPGYTIRIKNKLHSAGALHHYQAYILDSVQETDNQCGKRIFKNSNFFRAGLAIEVEILFSALQKKDWNV